MKYSFIIPVYNASLTIERCINSIINNGHTDTEIIVIDDCSADDSFAVCRKLADEHPIRIFQNEQNRGVSFTRNAGIEKATGDYLFFVDSDDWIDENYINLFETAIKDHPEAFIVSAFMNHDEKFGGRTDRYGLNTTTLFTSYRLQDVLKPLYDRTLLQQLWNKMFSREIIEKNNLRFDESLRVGEDFRFVISYLKHCHFENAVFINSPLYHYMRDQENSLMFNVNGTDCENNLLNIRDCFSLLDIDEVEKSALLSEEKEKLLKTYSYLIMHNTKMTIFEKKRQIEKINNNDSKMFWNQFVIRTKENAAAAVSGMKKTGKSVLIKFKRTIKEGGKQYKYFGPQIGLAGVRCIWEDESAESIIHKNETNIRYLEKEYQDIINCYKKDENSALKNDIDYAPIWTFWLQGEENMPEIIKLCHESKVSHARKHPIYVLTEKNVRDYVDLPEYIWSDYKAGKIRVQHLADMIRVCLLRKHGGLWLDASIFCHKDIPDEYFELPFYSLKYTFDNRYVSEAKWTSFVMGAWKNHTMYRFLDDFFKEYCKRGKPFIDYFLLDTAMELAYRNIPAVKKDVDAVTFADGDCYWLNTVLCEQITDELLDKYSSEKSVFYKIAWNKTWSTEENTLYNYLKKHYLSE